MKLSMIVIVGKNREIGCNNQLLWDIPEDMARFKQITSGHTVIMGDRTFESMNSKPLPKRKNIIISLDKNYQVPEDCILVHSIEDSIESSKKQEKNDEAFVIGGGTIYKLFLPLIDKLYITVVDDSPKADVYFPDYSEFNNIEYKKTSSQGALKYTFFELTK